ncbi:hypothetical protein [uncultured Nostoc sp.]|uniref:hypothetical protein n=1 Tax=uncultured Nostoc sp. TaxID=340711 RepID=UPI0035CA1368
MRISIERSSRSSASILALLRICSRASISYLKTLYGKNWRSNRAVLFLDPFGMQIPWSTIEAIAHTEAIDLWYLFPLGVAMVSRGIICCSYSVGNGYVARDLKYKS